MERETIKSYFKGRNFVTPIVLDYGYKGKLVYELSEGDFLGDKIFGVTVVNTEDVEDKSLSRSFDSLNEAYRFIDNGLK